MNSFAGGILSDFPLTPIQTDTAVPKQGRLAAGTLNCGYGQRSSTGEGRDWVPLMAGEKLGSNLTIPSSHAHTPVSLGEPKEKEGRGHG